jgi:hypothetical protein
MYCIHINTYTYIPLVAYMIADVGFSVIALVRWSIASSKFPENLVNSAYNSIVCVYTIIMICHGS